MTTLALIDDHEVVRYGISFILQGDESMKVVGEWTCGTGADEFVARTGADVVLLDILMPDCSGIEVLKDIRRRCPGQKVVMFSTSSVEEDIVQAIKNGANGYVLKDAGAQAILDAVRTVAAGGSYFPEDIASACSLRAAGKVLTDREREVLQFVSRGLHNEEIGEMLGITKDGVKKHMKNISRKLDASGRADAVRIGISRGIILP